MPKYVATADWHITDKTPRSRKDDYPAAQKKKIEWILKLAQKECADLLIAGDLFDEPFCSYECFNTYLKMFLKFPNSIFVCLGQHDIHNHDINTLNDTPFGGMLAAGAIQQSGGFSSGVEVVHWGQEPKLTMSDVLLTHKCVTPKNPPFFLPEGISIKKVANEYPGYMFRIFGDYHTPSMSIDSAGSTSINCGSLMRRNKDQQKYKPAVWLLDTINGSVENFSIPIDDDVFDLVKIKREEERKIEVKVQVDKLAKLISKDMANMSFKEVLDSVAEDLKVSGDVRLILNEAWIKARKLSNFS